MKSFSRFGLPTRWWRGQPSPVMLVETAEPDTPGAGEDALRVLLVDDEELIRRLATGMASRLGIDLSTVASAPAALAMARAGRLDVLVTDVLLGDGADGIDLARQILVLQPWASVVLMSGYSAAHFDLDGLPGDTQFLTKPFGADSLLQCLSEAGRRVSASGR